VQLVRKIPDEYSPTAYSVGEQGNGARTELFHSVYPFGTESMNLTFKYLG
jgi:hypothetical protein